MEEVFQEFVYDIAKEVLFYVARLAFIDFAFAVYITTRFN